MTKIEEIDLSLIFEENQKLEVYVFDSTDEEDRKAVQEISDCPRMPLHGKKNGMCVRTKGGLKIFINAESEKNPMTVLVHELFHAVDRIRERLNMQNVDDSTEFGARLMANMFAKIVPKFSEHFFCTNSNTGE